MVFSTKCCLYLPFQTARDGRRPWYRYISSTVSSMPIIPCRTAVTDNTLATRRPIPWPSSMRRRFILRSRLGESRNSFFWRIYPRLTLGRPDDLFVRLYTTALMGTRHDLWGAILDKSYLLLVGNGRRSATETAQKPPKRHQPRSTKDTYPSFAQRGDDAGPRTRQRRSSHTLHFLQHATGK